MSALRPLSGPPGLRGILRSAATLAVAGAALALLAAVRSAHAAPNQGAKPIGPTTPRPPLNSTYGATLFNYGGAYGDTALARGDDSYSIVSLGGVGPVGSSLNLPFFSGNYNNLYVSTNGVVSLGAGVTSYSPAPFPVSGQPAMIAPFWADVDTRNPDSGQVWQRTTQNTAELSAISARIAASYATATNFTPTFAQVVTWDRVGYYNQRADYVNTFQLVIASDGVQTYALYLYPRDAIWWTKGDISANHAIVGYSDANGNYHNIAGSGTLAMRDLDILTNTTPGNLGTFVFKLDNTPVGATAAQLAAASTRVVPGDLDLVGGTLLATHTLQLGDLAVSGTQTHYLKTASSSASLQFDRLLFDDPSETLAIVGASIGLNGTGVVLTNAADAITHGNLLFTGTSRLVAREAGAINGGTLTFQNNSSLHLWTADALTANARLQFDDGGTFDMRGLSTTVGSLHSVHPGSTLGTVTSTIAGARTLDLAGSADASFNGSLLDGSGTLTLLKSGPATQILSGTNNYTGNTTVTGGTLQFARPSAFYNGAVNGITAATAAKLTVGPSGLTAFNVGGANDFTLAQFLTLFANANFTGPGSALALDTTNAPAPVTLATPLTGPGGLAKNGPGTLVLAATTPNTHTGGTTVNGGTLVAQRTGETGTFAPGTTVTVNPSGTLVVNGDSLGWGNGAAKLVVNGGTVSSSQTSGIQTTLRDITMTGGRLTATTNGRYLLNGPLVTLASANTALIDTRLELLANTYNPESPTAFTIASGTTPTGIDLDITGVVHGSGALVKNGTGTLRLTADNTYTGNTTINEGRLILGSGGTTGSVPGTIVNNALLVFDRSGTTTHSGHISGTGTVVKNGSGTLSLLANNTYTGSTTVSAGTLQIGNGNLTGALAGDASVSSGATLAFNRSSDYAYSGKISGSGTLVKNGTNTLTLSGGSTGFYGTTTINSGTLRLGTASALGFSTGSIAIAPAATFDISAYGFNLARLTGTGLGAGTVTSSSAASLFSYNSADNFTLDPRLSGAGSLVKSGTGTLTLAGASTYTGSTTINGGTLSLGGDERLPSATALNIASGAILNLIARTQTVGALTGSGVVQTSGGTLRVGGGDASSTFSGSIVNYGTASALLEKIGTGTFIVSGQTTLPSAAPTNIAVRAGTLALGVAQTPGTAAVTVDSGATFDLANYSTLLVRIYGAGTIALGSATLTLNSGDASDHTFDGSITGAGNLVKNDTGQLLLRGASTYTGTTTINGGSLAIDDDERLSDSTALTLATGASLRLNGFTETIGGLQGAGNVFLSGGTLAVGGNNASTTFSGVLNGSGTFAKLGTGTLTLTGNNNTFSGGFSINSGTLRLASASASGYGLVAVASGATFDTAAYGLDLGRLSGSGTVTSSGGGVFTLHHFGTAEFALDASLTGTASLVKYGIGTLRLAGASTYTGPTSLNGGTIALDADQRLPATTALTLASGTSLALDGHAQTIGSLTGSGTVALGGGALTVGGNLASTTFSGLFLGSGALNKTGTGTLTLDNASLTGSGALQADVFIADGALVFQSNATQTVTGSLSGTGALLKTGPAALVLTGANTFTGNTTVSSGQLRIGDGGETGSLDGDITLAANATLVFDRSGELIRSGNLSGSGTLVKTGSGYLALAGDNTHTGSTLVQSGTLSAASLASSAVTVSAGATLYTDALGSLSGAGTVYGSYDALTIGHNNLSTVFDGQLRNPYAPAPELRKVGSGTLALGHSAALGSNYTRVSIEGGSIRLNHATALALGTVNLAGGALDFGALTSATLSGLTGSGPLVLENATGQAVNLTLSYIPQNPAAPYTGVLSGSGSLTLDKPGGYTAALAGANTYTGGTTIKQGWLQLTGAGTLGAAGSSLDLQSAGAALFLNGTSQSVGRLTGSAGLITNGSAANSTLTVGAGDADGAFGGVLANGSTGKLALVKTGLGTLTLSGANTYTGATLVNAGALRVNGTLANTALSIATGATLGGSGRIDGFTTLASGAHLAPGNSPGTLTFTNGLALSDGAILDFELGTTSDLIRITGGTLSGPLDGTITVNLIDSGGFTAGIYTLFNATGATLDSIGATSFVLGDSIDGYTYTFSQNENLFLLTATAVPEPATFATLAGLATLALAATRRRATRRIR